MRLQEMNCNYNRKGIIEKIDCFNLCLGCGLCSSVLGKEFCAMELREDGFYHPVVNAQLSKNEEEIVKSVCPAIHIEANNTKGAWGSMKYICESWSANKEIRHKAASGGVVTSLAICLLEQEKVDAVLQVGVRNDSYLYNELKISKTREEIINNAQSRYAPALVFCNIKEILDRDDSKYALIGKPCDIAAIQNLVREFPIYKGRVLYYISIFCAGMPSYNATVKTWQQSGRKDDPTKLKYRGDGWPGDFKATFKDGSFYQLSYNESWGKILGRNLGFRCKICPDGIGVLADISVGDSWSTVNGYPDFTEKEGKCFCMVRTQKGSDLIELASKKGYIISKQLDIKKIREQQPYQYERRKLEGWRLIPVQIVTSGILYFKGLAIWRQSVKANPLKGIKNFIGTYKRIKKSNGK